MNRKLARQPWGSQAIESKNPVSLSAEPPPTSLGRDPLFRVMIPGQGYDPLHRVVIYLLEPRPNVQGQDLLICVVTHWLGYESLIGS